MDVLVVIGGGGPVSKFSNLVNPSQNTFFTEKKI